MRKIFLILGCLAGCGGSSSSPPPGPQQSDMAWCQGACAKLMDCGVPYDATCATNCLSTPVFLACVKTSAQECNPLALCVFRQAGATYCGGEAAGTPSGGDSCKGGAACEGTCTQIGAPVSCGCKCWHAISPGKALNLLINNECANARCKTECAPGGSGSICLGCFAQNCPAESSQCQGN